MIHFYLTAANVKENLNQQISCHNLSEDYSTSASTTDNKRLSESLQRVGLADK